MVINNNFFLFLGEYTQNLCNHGDSTCQPCPNRLPSCRGVPDGDHIFPNKLWEPDYITCFKNRTIAVNRCPVGQIFHPVQHKCLIYTPGGE